MAADICYPQQSARSKNFLLTERTEQWHQVPYLETFTVPVEKKSLLLIGNDIASGKYKAEVEEIRALLEQGTEEAANKKKQLLAFTPSAVFSEKRQMPFLEMYSGFVHLDFDKLTPEQLDTAFKVIAEIPLHLLMLYQPKR
jgi:hypothetical protein